MPILNLKVSSLSPETLTKCAVAVTELTHSILRKDPPVTAVAMEGISPELWFLDGRSLASQGKASFHLHIEVTTGTNSKDEKARYVAEVYRALGAILGELHPATYIVVHDQPSDSWGYGGITQEHRYVARQLGAGQL